MGRKKKHRVAFRFYLVLFAGLCVAGYGAYAAMDSLVQRTAVIESGDLGNQYVAEAVVVRSEKLTDAEGLTTVRYYADEGAFVYRGNRIAEVYSTGYSQSDINKLLNTRSQIKSHHKTLQASAYADLQLDRLEAQIMDYARELEQMIQGKARGNLLNLERQLQAALTDRQSYLRTKYQNDQNLYNLYDEEAKLVKKIESWTSTYQAVADCIVSFYTDGYENALDASDIDSITAAQVRGVLNREAPITSAAQRGRAAVFREVRPNGWYLLLLSRDPNWNPVVGQSYKVQLAGFDDHVVDGEVTSFSRSGTELLVRMSVAGDVRPVLNVRTAQAQVGEMYVSGLKVPVAALYEQGGQKGVVLTDNGGIFVPVSIIMQDNAYAVIQPLATGALREGQKIRVF